MKRGVRAWANERAPRSLASLHFKPNRAHVHRVTDDTNDVYSTAVEEFLSWAKEQKLRLNSSDEIDRAAADFIKDSIFLSWRPIQVGRNLVAGLTHIYLDFDLSLELA